MAEVEDMIADIILLGSQKVLDDDVGGRQLKASTNFIIQHRSHTRPWCDGKSRPLQSNGPASNTGNLQGFFVLSDIMWHVQNNQGQTCLNIRSLPHPKDESAE